MDNNEALALLALYFKLPRRCQGASCPCASHAPGTIHIGISRCEACTELASLTHTVDLTRLTMPVCQSMKITKTMNVAHVLRSHIT